MIISKNDFEEKLKNESFAKSNPELIMGLKQLSKINKEIESLNVSKQCKNNLYSLNKVLSVLKEKKIASIINNIMLVSDNNLQELIRIILNILVKNRCCANIIYDNTSVRANRYNINKEIGGLNIIKLDNKFELGDQLIYLKEYNKKVFNLVISSEDSLVKIDSYFFPYTINNKYTDEEKLNMLKSMCDSFSFQFINNQDNSNNLQLSYEKLNKIANKKILEKIACGNSVLSLSEIKIDNPGSKQIPHDNNYKLSEMIGLGQVKTFVARLIEYMKKNKTNISSRHMAFLGNPGTGKTIVARCLAKELYEKGIIKKNILVETDRSGLVGEYIGKTALKTKEKIEQAMGGILFIDEAYALAHCDSDKDFGHEALAILIKAMEDHRDNLIVIFAGYKDKMQRLFSMNQGLRSRIQYIMEFPDYTVEELKQIMNKMTFDLGYEVLQEAEKEIVEILEKEKNNPNFSNGRYIRNMIEKLLLIQSERADDYTIRIEDVKKYIAEQPIHEERRRMGFCD